MRKEQKAIGVFDSGYGGLTILKELREVLPEYDFLYLGDNARAPYGTRSFDVVYEFTLQAVEYLFAQGCELVILACNTASAKALRSIQQQVLPVKYPNKRVLGVIRPTTEIIGDYSEKGHVGIVATEGTVKSESYLIEIAKYYPNLKVAQQACPIWVPLIENNLHLTEGGRSLIRNDIENLLRTDPELDVILLACTHYPILMEEIKTYLPEGIRLISQGIIVANSLKDYLSRHPEIDKKLSKESVVRYLTTENPSVFSEQGSTFLGVRVRADQVRIEK
ncbi:MAG: glutamate racemase [Bacteroidetes bacterium]|nr:MAG: glutamate racemase [Bacteroidota bacterium]